MTAPKYAERTVEGTFIVTDAGTVRPWVRPTVTTRRRRPEPAAGRTRRGHGGRTVAITVVVVALVSALGVVGYAAYLVVQWIVDHLAIILGTAALAAIGAGALFRGPSGPHCPGPFHR